MLEKLERYAAMMRFTCTLVAAVLCALVLVVFTPPPKAHGPEARDRER